MPNPFSGDGDWYKGNLHTHTTVSDGALSPQETIRIYAEEDYDFLALTDHDAVVDYDGLDAHGMTLITGCELDGGRGELGQDMHVVALGLDAAPQLPDSYDFTELVAAISSECELCFVAHPFGSLNETSDLLGLQGHIGSMSPGGVRQKWSGIFCLPMASACGVLRSTMLTSAKITARAGCGLGQQRTV